MAVALACWLVRAGQLAARQWEEMSYRWFGPTARAGQPGKLLCAGYKESDSCQLDAACCHPARRRRRVGPKGGGAELPFERHAELAGGPRLASARCNRLEQSARAGSRPSDRQSWPRLSHDEVHEFTWPTWHPQSSVTGKALIFVTEILTLPCSLVAITSAVTRR